MVVPPKTLKNFTKQHFCDSFHIDVNYGTMIGLAAQTRFKVEPGIHQPKSHWKHTVQMSNHCSNTHLVHTSGQSTRLNLPESWLTHIYMRSESKGGLTTFKQEENVIKTEPQSIPDAKHRQREAAPNHSENTRVTERPDADNTEADRPRCKDAKGQRSRDSSAQQSSRKQSYRC